MFQGGHEFWNVGSLVDLDAESRGTRHAPHVPAQMFAHLQQRPARTAPGDGQLQVAHGRCQALTWRAGRCRPLLQGQQQVPDQPGVAVAAATAHDAVAGGFPQHAQTVGGAEDIPAADDGHRQCRFQLGDQTPVGLAGKSLAAGAGMQNDGIRALRHGDAGDLQEVDGLGIPAGPQLDRQGSGGGLAHRGDDGRHALRGLHEGTAGAGADHFLHRTAHVDVQQIAPTFHHARRFGQYRRVFPEQLDAQGPILGDRAQQFHGTDPFPDQTVGADHLREGQADAILSGD